MKQPPKREGFFESALRDSRDNLFSLLRIKVKKGEITKKEAAAQAQAAQDALNRERLEKAEKVAEMHKKYQQEAARAGAKARQDARKRDEESNKLARAGGALPGEIRNAVRAGSAATSSSGVEPKAPGVGVGSSRSNNVDAGSPG